MLDDINLVEYISAAAQKISDSCDSVKLAVMHSDILGADTNSQIKLVKAFIEKVSTELQKIQNMICT